MYNVVTTLAPSFFEPIFYILAGNKDSHKSFDEFEFQAESPSYWASGQIYIDLQRSVGTTAAP